MNNKLSFLPYVFVALVAVGRVSLDVSMRFARVYQICMHAIIVWWLSASTCSLVGLGSGRGMFDELSCRKHVKTYDKN